MCIHTSSALNNNQTLYSIVLLQITSSWLANGCMQGVHSIHVKRKIMINILGKRMNKLEKCNIFIHCFSISLQIMHANNNWVKFTESMGEGVGASRRTHLFFSSKSSSAKF